MEFQEVMRQWTRICNVVPGKSDGTSICTDKKSGYICPMHRNGLCNKSVSGQTDDDRLEGEKIIMAWAAEHPEPVYPSVAEHLERLGIIIRRDGTLQADFFKAHKPMSADVAKLLCIKPKEGA